MGKFSDCNMGTFESGSVLDEIFVGTDSNLVVVPTRTYQIYQSPFDTMIFWVKTYDLVGFFPRFLKDTETVVFPQVSLKLLPAGDIRHLGFVGHRPWCRVWGLGVLLKWETTGTVMWMICIVYMICV